MELQLFPLKQSNLLKNRKMSDKNLKCDICGSEDVLIVDYFQLLCKKCKEKKNKQENVS